MAVNLHLVHFRFGVADGTESTHTWYANEDVAATTVPVDTNFLLRLGIQQTEATAAANLAQQFRYNHNGAGWVNITTSSTVVKAITPTTFADTATSTTRLTLTGSRDTTNANCTVDGSSGGNANDVPASGHSETVCGLYINSAQVEDGDIIQFDCTISGPTTTLTKDIDPYLVVLKAGTSKTPSSTPSGTPSSSATPSRTPSSSATPSQTPSSSATPSQTPSSSATPSQTPSFSATPSQTPSQTPSSSATPSRTPSASSNTFSNAKCAP
jgi:hypothetical protein